MYIYKLKLPFCPHCKYKLSFLDAFINKNKPVYRCRLCQRRSSVILKPAILKHLWCVQVFSVFVFVVTLLSGGGVVVLGFGIIFLLFVSFYFISPYMIFLEEPIYVPVSKKNKKTKKEGSTEDIGEQNEKTPKKDKENMDIYSN
ncbi:MAG: hypothetical protein LBR79_05195 [Oscillospiraceae bacterium]|nr:hypothetical protein [Oscillospiraceae bacterium]